MGPEGAASAASALRPRRPAEHPSRVRKGCRRQRATAGAQRRRAAAGSGGTPGRTRAARPILTQYSAFLQSRSEGAFLALRGRVSCLLGSRSRLVRTVAARAGGPGAVAELSDVPAGVGWVLQSTYGQAVGTERVARRTFPDCRADLAALGLFVLLAPPGGELRPPWEGGGQSEVPLVACRGLEPVAMRFERARH